MSGRPSKKPHVEERPRMMLAGSANVDQEWNEIKNEGILKLQQIIDGGFKEGLGHKMFMLLYTKVYNLCAKPGEEGKKNSFELYDRYRDSIASYLTEKVLPALKDKQDVYLLSEFVKKWENHRQMIKWHIKLFSYLDRFHIPREKLTALHDLGVDQFNKIIFAAVKKEVRAVLLGLTRKERDGERVERDLMKHTIEIFVEMDPQNMSTYMSDFEEQLLSETAEFYSRESARWADETTGFSCPEYMKKAEQCLQEELQRVTHYLHSSTEPKLMKVCDDNLLANIELKLLEMENSGCEALLRDNKVEDLSRMYRLFLRLQNGLPPISQIFKKHISDEGLQLVEKHAANEESKQYIHGLIRMHDKYLDLVHKCFAGNPLFHKVMSEAFILFINKETGKKSTAEQLATFCDTLLKQGGEKDYTDEERDQTLDKVVALLRYVLGNDVFEAFYKQDLARRLIMSKSVSIDAEKSMITKLKQELGASFTSKLDVMLRDLDLSKEITNSFKLFIQNNYATKLGDVDVNVSVLTTGFWPNYQAMDLKLPKELSDFQETFRDYYLKKHNGRKISWHYGWSSCILKAHFALGKKELAASLFQAVIILLFNNAERLTLKDIQEQTGIEDKEMRRALLSLSISKMKILLKEPPAKELKDDDVFSINSKFTNQMYRIKLNAIQMKETNEENQQTNKRVFQDRQYQIDAAIVRIMKTRKQLNHNLLVSEIYTQLKFPFKPADLKKRIESLIEREYLARDKDNAQVYIYLP